MTRKRLLLTLFPVFLLMLAWSILVFEGTPSCVQCGMVVDLNSRDATKIVQGETTSYFCDSGDPFAYLYAKGPPSGDGERLRLAIGLTSTRPSTFVV